MQLIMNPIIMGWKARQIPILWLEAKINCHRSALIKKLIAAEKSNKPLSDNKIAVILSDQGIKVARYRYEHRFVGTIAQTCAFQQMTDTLSRLFPRHPVKIRGKVQVASRGKTRIERRLLEHDTGPET